MHVKYEGFAIWSRGGLKARWGLILGLLMKGPATVPGLILGLLMKGPATVPGLVLGLLMKDQPRCQGLSLDY